MSDERAQTTEPVPWKGDLRPVRSTDVAAVDIEGETLLYHEVHGTLHLLDPIATVVWESLDGARTASALSRDLAVTFAADAVEVSHDVARLLAALHESDLVRAAGGRNAG